MPIIETVLSYARKWIETQTYESKPKDAARIELYLAPSVIALVPLVDLRAKHVLAHIQWLSKRPSERGGTLAPRTVRSAYDVLRRSLDAAVIDEFIAANPCAPIRGKLPAIEDKDPTARQGWLYSREEIVRLLTDERIPEVRRVSYALQFLTGMRVGELAVLRFKDYDPKTKPLGRLTIARAVKSVSLREAQTKTGAIKFAPVHPTLAPILERWRTKGFALYMGREPTDADLIVPNQHNEVRNTNRHNRDLGRDCAKLGIEHRHQHTMRHSFITHALDDGADGNILRWITHAPPRTAFDTYARGQWQRLCSEVSKLAIALPAESDPEPQANAQPASSIAEAVQRMIERHASSPEDESS
ncbi:MAG: tyrosine-type recombinase/integrase [Myxococcales bacterium]|nr:tyrosine-type recombinase/integrase [Myxococcales bacterium]